MSNLKERENWVGGTTIPTPTTEKLLVLARAYMSLLRAESIDAWDMDQLAMCVMNKRPPHWEERARAYRAVGVALDAIEEGAE